MKTTNYSDIRGLLVINGAVNAAAAAGGGLIFVTDGVTVVGPVTSILFTDAKVADLGADELAVTGTGHVFARFTNKTGQDVLAGDVVIIDPGNNTAITSTPQARSETSVGIVYDTIIPSNSVGFVQLAGFANSVRVPFGQNRGYYLETNSVRYQAVGNSLRRSGSFGQLLTTGLYPSAWLWGGTDQTAGGGSSPLTTKGDVWGYSSVDARIPVGTNSTFLMASSIDTLGVAWGTPAGGSGGSGSGAVLNATSYSTGSDTAWATVTSSTATDIDATHAALTVTIPASGKVIVSVDLDVGFSYGVFPWGPGYLCIKNGSTELQAQPMNFYGNIATDARYTTVGGRYHATFVLTGLTPGSMTLKAALRSDGTQTCYAFANDGAGGAGHYAGPFEMVVWDGTSGGGSSTGSGGGRVLLESHTASASATLDFTTRNAPGQSGATIQSDYDEYEIEVVGLKPATNATSLYMRMGTGGGPTWDSSNIYSTGSFRFVATGGTAAAGSDPATQIVLDGGNGTDTLRNDDTYTWFNGSYLLFNPSPGTIYPSFLGHSQWVNTVPAAEGATVNGRYASHTSITGLRFLMSSGNITLGTIRIYGIDKTGGGVAGLLTTKGDLHGFSTVDARVPVGGNSTFLMASSIDALGVAYATPPAGALVLLEQHTASSSATLDFTTFISSTYETYVFEFLNVLPATNGVDFLWRAGTGGGPTYDSTSGHYAFTDSYSYISTGGGEGSSTGQTAGSISGLVGNTNMGVCGSARLVNPQQTATWKPLVGQITNDHSSVNLIQRNFTAVFLQTTAMTAVRFLFSSGNIASGTIRVYGIVKS